MRAPASAGSGGGKGWGRGTAARSKLGRGGQEAACAHTDAHAHTHAHTRARTRMHTHPCTHAHQAQLQCRGLRGRTRRQLCPRPPGLRHRPARWRGPPSSAPGISRDVQSRALSSPRLTPAVQFCLSPSVALLFLLGALLTPAPLPPPQRWRNVLGREFLPSFDFKNGFV